MSIVLIHNMVEENGKTIKENNLERKHSIPLGALVEITYESKYEDEEESKNGLRLFVVNHSRDCDGTPLYDLSFDKSSYKKYAETKQKIDNNDFESAMDASLVRWVHNLASGSILRHYGEESLKVISVKE